MNADRIKFQILPDGKLSVTTDQVSGENHLDADQLLEFIQGMLGGECDRKKRSAFEVNVDLTQTDAFKEHTHDGHTHDHQNWQ